MATWLRAAALTLTLAVVAACTPSTVTSPSPSVSSVQPTYLCSGAPGTSPAPCDKAKYDEQQKAKALEDEAKGVYERYWKEYTRLLQQGGSDASTPELSATVASPALEDVVALLKYQKDRGIKVSIFKSSLKLAIRSQAVRSDAEVSIVACEDTTGSLFVDQNGQQVASGVLNVQVSGMRRINGVLKIYYNEEASRPCPVA